MKITVLSPTDSRLSYIVWVCPACSSEFSQPLRGKDSYLALTGKVRAHTQSSPNCLVLIDRERKQNGRLRFYKRYAHASK